MSLKAELETWAAALQAYDDEDFDKSLELFSSIADNSKILTNMGLIYATLGEHEAAVDRFVEATNLDQYLAVAYFQSGVSNFLLSRFERAYQNFDEALLYLRGNQAINYEQLGLKFRLFSAEVLFNRGLSLINLGQTEQGLADMEEAKKDKATDEHGVIDDAIADGGVGYTVFSIPVGVLYRPSEKKLKNARQKDYMGKAKLVASSDPNDAITTFTGPARLKMGISPSGVYVDRPDISGEKEAGPTASGSGGGGLGRSATMPLGIVPPRANESRSGVVERSRTVGLGVSTDVRRGGGPLSASASAGPSAAGGASASGGGVTRKLTQITPARPSGSATIGGPTRGLSVRRAEGPPPPAKDKDGNGRLTEFYDDYLEGYGADANPPPPPQQQNASGDRVSAWARNAAVGRQPTSRSAPNSAYAPSSYGSMRRKPTRRGGGGGGGGRMSSRVQSTYEEEEEGYVSGDYDDGPMDLNIIRVKLHYQGDTRGMTMPPDMSFVDFMDKVTIKFEKGASGLGLKFKDEDGGMVTLRDESDFELAIETARESAKGKMEGKLEVWCLDL